MAKPAVIEARKARALEAMQEQLDRIEAKLDAVLGREVSGTVELTVFNNALEAVNTELIELEPPAAPSEPQPEPEKGKGKNK